MVRSISFWGPAYFHVFSGAMLNFGRVLHDFWGWNILIGPDLERGEHAPYQWYQWWRCRLHTTAIPWWGGICLWKIINIYIHSWICILHMSAVRLYALSEVIKGDNEFKIFMRNLGPYFSLEMWDSHRRSKLNLNEKRRHKRQRESVRLKKGAHGDNFQLVVGAIPSRTWPRDWPIFCDSRTCAYSRRNLMFFLGKFGG